MTIRLMTILVPPLDHPIRLDKFLIQTFPHTSRNFWNTHLTRMVRINHKKTSKGQMLHGGESIDFLEELPKPNPQLLPNPDLDLEIIFEDPYLLAINKPACISCYPLEEKEKNTIANAIVARYPEQAKLDPPLEAGLIHRLDYETSGVLLVARSQDALKIFKNLSQTSKITKNYLAIVEGSLEGQGSIDLPIAHHPKNKKKMRTLQDLEDIKKSKGQRVATQYQVLENLGHYSIVRLSLKKGARHQVRVHLAAIGHPIVGDKLYGKTSGNATHKGRHFLHATGVKLFHPYLKKEIEITAPISEGFTGRPSVTQQHQPQLQGTEE